jgi:hypothetical protein
LQAVVFSPGTDGAVNLPDSALPYPRVLPTVGGVQATSFAGYKDHMGDTREVWFIHAGFLYEITTYKPLVPWLMQILQTWRFI